MADPTPAPVAPPLPPAGGRQIYIERIDLRLDLDPPRLDFVRADGAPAPPPDMQGVRQNIEDVARVVRLLFADDRQTLEELFNELKITAETGLSSDNYDIGIGTENLEEVRSHIVDMFPKVREKLWRSNLVILGFATCLCLPLALGLAAARPVFGTLGQAFRNMDPAAAYAVTEAAVLIPFGVAVGLFIEFILRVNNDLTYDELTQINPGRWQARARALNTTIVAYVFAGMLGMGVVQVGVGAVRLDDFLQPSQPWLSFVIGFLTGFAFPYVRDILQKVRPTSS